jgi:hypothetical protein
MKTNNTNKKMRKNVYLLILLTFLLIGIVNANLGNFPKDTCVPLSTNLNVSSVTISNLIYPNQTIITINSLMSTLDNHYYNYSFCNTSSMGNYVYNYYDNQGNTYSNNFFIGIPATDFLTTFIWILFIADIIFIFVLFFVIILKLVLLKQTIFDVLLCWFSFILLIIVNYISGIYFVDTFIFSITSSIIKYTTWTHVILPLLSFIIVIFIRMTQKKKVLSPQEMSGRFPFQ